MADPNESSKYDLKQHTMHFFFCSLKTYYTVFIIIVHCIILVSWPTEQMILWTCLMNGQILNLSWALYPLCKMDLRKGGGQLQIPSVLVTIRGKPPGLRWACGCCLIRGHALNCGHAHSQEINAGWRCNQDFHLICELKSGSSLWLAATRELPLPNICPIETSL